MTGKRRGRTASCEPAPAGQSPRVTPRAERKEDDVSYTLKVGCDYKGTVIDVKSDEDEVDVPKPEDPEIGTVAMDIETVLSHAAEYATDDDEEVWLEFINE